MPRNTILAAIATVALVGGGALAQSQQGTVTAPEPTAGAAGQSGTVRSCGAFSPSRGTAGTVALFPSSSGSLCRHFSYTSVKTSGANERLLEHTACFESPTGIRNAVSVLGFCVPYQFPLKAAIGAARNGRQREMPTAFNVRDDLDGKLYGGEGGRAQLCVALHFRGSEVRIYDDHV